MSAELLTTIGNLGFPIAVSVYLLVRFESKLEALTLSINDLSITIRQNLNSWNG
ncbi:YvrJ family protein [Clostridium sp. A1-XYC3]|uniref:YvrJ family protein n=1 Tax=Clostridium tanneri TaxID=3037988 RepID=A0ABU4JVI2_9CLOT|nr:YvrJ family protein [Clostridium sp. A1-XYC3]MDW8802143.1 YvrJ family protein [Clostridium sp. A1-XYC3]